MMEFEIGGFVKSRAGHDFGKTYVIFDIDKEYLYLVDGKIRTLNNPKKKKMKHLKALEQIDCSLADKVRNKTIGNEEIKRTIKLLQVGDSDKEVE
jgi:ribosomal protein L14E/L6E/L27E